MIPGTTPKHVFALPFAPQKGSGFSIVYAQGEKYREKILIELGTNRCNVDDKILSVRLTREETLKFSQTPIIKQGVMTIPPVWIQIGIKTPAGDILWSEPIETTVERLLKPGGEINE